MVIFCKVSSFLAISQCKSLDRLLDRATLLLKSAILGVVYTYQCYGIESEGVCLLSDGVEVFARILHVG